MRRPILLIHNWPFRKAWSLARCFALKLIVHLCPRDLTVCGCPLWEQRKWQWGRNVGQYGAERVKQIQFFYRFYSWLSSLRFSHFSRSKNAVDIRIYSQHILFWMICVSIHYFHHYSYSFSLTCCMYREIPVSLKWFESHTWPLRIWSILYSTVCLWPLAEAQTAASTALCTNPCWVLEVKTPLLIYSSQWTELPLKRCKFDYL